MFRRAVSGAIAGIFLASAVAEVSAAATVNVVVDGCRNCQLTWISTESERGWPTQKPTPLDGRTATITLPKAVTAYALGVTYGKRGFSGLSALDVVAFQYRGFAPGDRVADVDSRAARRARVCHPVVDGETVRVRVAKVPISAAVRKRSVIPIPKAQKYTLRAWANPALATTDNWTQAWKGETGVQNTICGADWPWNR